MKQNPMKPHGHPSPRIFSIVAAASLMLAFACSASAQRTDFAPDTLANQRSSIYVKATQGPLAQVEGELNRLAVLSETCRAEYGTKACGLPDKVLGSDKLEERYAYYVKRPVESRLGNRVKVSRGNWDTPRKTDSKPQVGSQ